jgi:hypothetical protein
VEPQKTLRSPPFSSIGCKQVPPYILYVTFFIYRNFDFDSVFGEYIVAHLWECSSGADNRFDYGYALKVQNRLFAKFADLAGGAVGKLSFKERDVSFFRIFDACKS